MSAIIGILLFLLALTWELVGVASKQPRVDTYSQMVWAIRDWVKDHTGKAGVYTLGAALFGFFGWLFVHFMVGGG